MHRDQEQFADRGTVIISIGPDDAGSFKKYWQKNDLSFIGLPDEQHSVLKLYGQQVNLFKLGRQPAQMVIDKQGILRYVHYGHSMKDIPSNEKLFDLLDQL